MGKGSGWTRKKKTVSNPISYTINGAFEKHVRISIRASERLNKIVEDKNEFGFSKDGSQFKFAVLSKTISDIYEKETGVKILNRDVYTGQSTLFHHRGGRKEEVGKMASLEDIVSMPINIGSMDIYIHSGALIFTDYKNKFVLHVNKEVKIDKGKKIIVNHVSSSVVKDQNDFSIWKGYKKINP